MSFALPKDVNVIHKNAKDNLCFYEQSNEKSGGDGFLFSLSKVKNLRAEWNSSPVIVAYRDGAYLRHGFLWRSGRDSR